MFWCEEDKDLPAPCKGVLDWIHVPKDQTRKNITVRDDKKFYKFAIAANYKNGKSSGLVWASCVILHDKLLKKVDAVTVNTKSAREADVSWEVRCAQIAAIQGFNVYYCPVTSPNDSGCKEKESEVEVSGGERRNVTLTNLKPYTTYKVQVAIVSINAESKSQMGPRKESNLFTTQEGAPSMPYGLSVDNITNTSALLKWKAPLEKNGVLQIYNIHVKNLSNSEYELAIVETIEAKVSFVPVFRVSSSLGSKINLVCTFVGCIR